MKILPVSYPPGSSGNMLRLVSVEVARQADCELCLQTCLNLLVIQDFRHELIEVSMQWRRVLNQIGLCKSLKLNLCVSFLLGLSPGNQVGGDGVFQEVVDGVMSLRSNAREAQPLSPPLCPFHLALQYCWRDAYSATGHSAAIGHRPLASPYVTLLQTLAFALTTEAPCWERCGSQAAG